MGRYRGGRGGRGGSGALIQIVVYLVIHIIEAIIRAVANRSKTPKVKAREYYKEYNDDDRDDDRDDDERAYKKRRKQEYAREPAYKQATPEPIAEQVAPKKSSKSFIFFAMVAVILFTVGFVFQNEGIILGSIGTFALGLLITLTRKPQKQAQPVNNAKPAPSANTTVTELRRICEHLEDEALIANVQEIIKYTVAIEDALVKYPNAKKGELVQE
ncbi:MAG: hypothetical protein LBV04_06835, partial [Deferribacteraceae bacterium]|nr:hypothetical protein [Deferribacteraceae bacterium]